MKHFLVKYTCNRCSFLSNNVAIVTDCKSRVVDSLRSCECGAVTELAHVVSEKDVSHRWLSEHGNHYREITANFYVHSSSAAKVIPPVLKAKSDKFKKMRLVCRNEKCSHCNSPREFDYSEIVQITGVDGCKLAGCPDCTIYTGDFQVLPDEGSSIFLEKLKKSGNLVKEEVVERNDYSYTYKPRVNGY